MTTRALRGASAACLVLALGCIDVDTIPAPVAGPPTLQWSEPAAPPRPSERSGHAMATLGDKVVLFGNPGTTGFNTQAYGPGDTWEWDGVKWTQRTPAASPSARSRHAMATLGNKVVLFGGRETVPIDPSQGIGALTNDTWEWDGTAWTKRTPAQSPPPRWEHAMVTLGDKVVLFGGFSECDPFGDTWEWDGNTWTERTTPSPSGGPSARHRHAMAALGNKVVLFGGEDTTETPLDDTWEWDGASWALKVPALGAAPDARGGHRMVTLGDKVFLFGGGDVGGVFPKVPIDGDVPWQWDGTSWTELDRPDGPSPTARMDFAMAGLNGGVLIFGGYLGTAPPAKPLGTLSGVGAPAADYFANDTWEWTGARWLERLAPPAGGLGWGTSAMATLGDKAVLVRTGSGTFVWDGALWTEIATPMGPGGYGHAMATLAGKVVLFGGTTGGSDASEDTWEWDGASWTLRDVATRPAGRSGHAMATLGDEIVLFGGSTMVLPSQNEPIGDTWVWDGNTWSIRTPPVSPPARANHAMATLGKEIILFGGEGLDGAPLDDTWAWNGASWTKLATSPSPPARSGLALAPLGASLILFGGHSGDTLLHDTWALTGGVWTQLSPHDFPTARANHAMVNVGGEIVLVGGSETPDTWILAAQGAAGGNRQE
jgi:N-acetylneuraminic acid mutarotase